MKLLTGIERKEFRGWSGGRLDIVKLSGEGFQIFLHSEGDTLGVQIDQDEASKIADQMIALCALCSQRGSLETGRTYLQLANALGETLVVQYVNDGEPFREGVRLSLAVQDRWELGKSLDFEQYEAKEIARFLKEVE